MRRHFSVDWEPEIPPAPERIDWCPERLAVPLPNAYGLAVQTVVHVGDAVADGAPLAECPEVVVRAPLSGTVRDLNSARVVLETDGRGNERRGGASPAEPGRVSAAFLRDIGLLGMGGSLFPASRKFASAQGIHTLVINGVECEPGITIDRAILRHEPEPVIRGARALAEALGAETVLLALGRRQEKGGTVPSAFPFPVAFVPGRYPAGSERLIQARLTGKLPATGERPTHGGYLVHNVASLRAIGLALLHGIPVGERPLSLVRPDTGFYRNVVVPIGTEFGVLLERLGVAWDGEADVAVAGGLMMGRRVAPEDAVSPGTTSLIVLRRKDWEKPERGCIRCGACNDVCPLGLHPVGMLERLRAGRASAALRIQVEDCFLCGACSGVCPSRIPLAKVIREGKTWQALRGN